MFHSPGINHFSNVSVLFGYIYGVPKRPHKLCTARFLVGSTYKKCLKNYTCATHRFREKYKKHSMTSHPVQGKTLHQTHLQQYLHVFSDDLYRLLSPDLTPLDLLLLMCQIKCFILAPDVTAYFVSRIFLEIYGSHRYNSLGIFYVLPTRNLAVQSLCGRFGTHCILGLFLLFKLC